MFRTGTAKRLMPLGQGSSFNHTSKRALIRKRGYAQAMESNKSPQKGRNGPTFSKYIA
jgi:hypothetical protein